MLRGRIAILLLLGWCSVASAFAAPAADRREIAAREAYVTGRYQQALELYGKLYAETLHPTYLRNIGRCYQSLRDPDRAISTFRDYLRKAPAVSAPERAEIEGYIAEMETLKRQQAEQARPARAAEPPRLAARPEPPLPMVTAGAPAPAPEPGPSRWWLWTGLGALVAAGVVTAVLVTRRTDAPCPMGIACYRP
jgi:tetratricopeptide (TPR) repeat protein